jgi:hypothetical protein
MSDLSDDTTARPAPPDIPTQPTPRDGRLRGSLGLGRVTGFGCAFVAN